ncbi:MAG: hypothetical protein ACFB16_26835 [Phormidesmis sp.]
MKPVSSDSDHDDSQLPEHKRTEHRQTERRQSGEPSPLENLQRRYTDQLSEDIEQLEAQKEQLEAQKEQLETQKEQLEAQKTGLQDEIATLRQDYVRLQADVRSLRQAASSAAPPKSPSQLPGRRLAEAQPSTELTPQAQPDAPPVERMSAQESGPRLPGEDELPPSAVVSASGKNRSLELPTPATSEQRRQMVVQRQRNIAPLLRAQARRGLILSAIAALLTAWHYGLVNTLLHGGQWLGIDIGQLGLGFVPAVALLWLRMLVLVPALFALAPQLYRPAWDDLQDWFYHDEQLFLPLVGSGIALFFSQVFLYQSIGGTGVVVGTGLLFLYPLTAIPIGLVWRQETALTPFGLLAIVAIAMGGLLLAKPALTTASPAAVGIGLLASVTLSLFVALTNLSYRQQCHPVPTAVVQFSTVAVLSSLVLLVKPLKLVSISWLSFCLWGLLIGVLALIAYLFTYSSLRLIGSKTALVAATTPVLVLLLSWSFVPQASLEIIQWTGILMVSIGGIALGKEKLVKEN